MIVDMGDGAELAGKSQYDTSAPESIPIVGNYLEVQIEKLLAIDPTDILMMTGKEGPPKRLLETAASHNIKVVNYTYPDTVADVVRILTGDAAVTGVPNLGQALDDVSGARRVAGTMTAQLERIQKLTGAGVKPKVLMVISTTPLMASGPHTVLDDLLTHYIGALNAAGDARVSAPTYDRESVLALAPDVVLLLLPSAPALQSIEDDPRLAELRGAPVPAVEHHRIILLDDPLLLLPSSNLSRVAATLAKAIHPDLAGAIDRAMASPKATTAP